MDKFEQNILCISSKDLRSIDGKWNGLQTKYLSQYMSLFNKKGVFVKRRNVENDSNFKQIIPQIILKYYNNGENKYFLHKQTKISEKRLSNMFPIFLGGHIEEIDGMVGDENLIDNATQRELREEVLIQSNIISKEFKGIIYIEDENIVNHMHIGLVRIYNIDGENVNMNEDKLEKIGFLTKIELLKYKENMTFWSSFYLKYL